MLLLRWFALAHFMDGCYWQVLVVHIHIQWMMMMMLNMSRFSGDGQLVLDCSAQFSWVTNDHHNHHIVGDPGTLNVMNEMSWDDDQWWKVWPKMLRYMFCCKWMITTHGIASKTGAPTIFQLGGGQSLSFFSFWTSSSTTIFGSLFSLHTISFSHSLLLPIVQLRLDWCEVPFRTLSLWFRRFFLRYIHSHRRPWS